MNLIAKQKVLFMLAIIGVVFGGYFAVEEWFMSASFATNDGMIWTLPLVSYIFLALISTGISIFLALGDLFNIQIVKDNKKLLVVSALAILVGAFAALATELGSPQGVFWLLLSPNLNSPIWWMGTLYFIELVFLGIKYISLVMDKPFSFDRYITIGTLVVASCAAMVLGSVFGTVIGRVGYWGVDSSLLTLSLALASGSCMLILMLPQLVHDVFSKWFLRASFIAVSLILVLKWIYLNRAGIPAQSAWVFPLAPLVFIVVIPLLTHTHRILAVVPLIMSLWVELAFVTQGQINTLGPKATWFGTSQVYIPNLPEVGILVFGISVGYIVFILAGGIAKKAQADEK
jgi:hypothetical protein